MGMYFVRTPFSGTPRTSGFAGSGKEEEKDNIGIYIRFMFVKGTHDQLRPK